MGRFKKMLHVILLVGLLAGLYISSSQPYEDQDIRGQISEMVDESKWQERLQNVRVEYGGREISVDEEGTAGFIEFFLRKAAHFVTFACLALFWYLVLRHWLSAAVALPWSGFLSVMAAALDEWHQTITPNRTGMVNDVLLDAAGIVTMMALIGLFNLWSRKKKRDKIEATDPF